MIDKLPYPLTEGVTATREGLVVNGYRGQVITRLPTDEWEDAYESETGWGLILWPDAAKQLRSRRGEPYCEVSKSVFSGIHCFCVDTPEVEDTLRLLRLHRLAAILCDDAEAFRVLHACIEEFGDG